MELLETAGIAVGVHVIADRAAAVTDRAAQNLFDRAAQARDLRPRQFARDAHRMNSRDVQGLIGIDVAQTCKEALVEERDFDGASRASQLPRQLCGAREQRLGTQVFVGLGAAREPPDASEAAGVPEAKLLVENPARRVS
jgi:hypothetical protein